MSIEALMGIDREFAERVKVYAKAQIGEAHNFIEKCPDDREIAAQQGRIAALRRLIRDLDAVFAPKTKEQPTHDETFTPRGVPAGYRLGQ